MRIIARLDIKNNYVIKGINFEGFNLTKYKSGNGIDADKLESHFVKKVIDKNVLTQKLDYSVKREQHAFEDVNFLGECKLIISIRKQVE